MGGKPCAEIIINGGYAQAAVARYDASGLPIKADTTDLLAAIENSCELTSFASMYLGFDHEELPDTVTLPINQFHKHLIANIMTMTPAEIGQAADRLKHLNEALRDAIA